MQHIAPTSSSAPGQAVQREVPVQPVLGMEVPLTLPATPGGGGAVGEFGGGGSGSAVGGELRLLARRCSWSWAWSRSRHRVPMVYISTTEESRKQRPCGWSLVEGRWSSASCSGFTLLPENARFTDSPQMEVREAWTP